MEATEEKLIVLTMDGQVFDAAPVYRRIENVKVRPAKQATGFFKDGIFYLSNVYKEVTYPRLSI